MSDTKKSQRPAEIPKRGEAAWRAERDAIARRNEDASRTARARRQGLYEQQVADRLAADRRQREQFAARRTP